MRHIAFLLATLSILTSALQGCATNVFNQAGNAPMTRDTAPGMGAREEFTEENMIALSFSGGGLRSAAFAYGVLRALEDTRTPDGDLLNDVHFITSVSGGSLVAAHFGLYGREGMAHFRENVLLQDYEARMRLAMLQPANLLRILKGGLNDRGNFGETLDREVFHGATYADMYRNRNVDVRINATDLYGRIAFPFIPRVFSMLCSDIRSYHVADAVAASMAVPLVFAPVVLRTYPDHCFQPPLPGLAQIRADPDSPRLLKAMEKAIAQYRDPNHVRYIKLVDGGVTDNYGLSTILVSRAVLGTPYAPMSEREAARVHRLLFLIVDAQRGLDGDWTLSESGPSGVDSALYAITAATDASGRLAVDSFDRMVAEWQDAVIRFRCGLSAQEVERLRGSAAEWNCADVKFSVAFLSIDGLEAPYRELVDNFPTRLSATPEQIDATIEGARREALGLHALGDYVRETRH